MEQDTIGGYNSYLNKQRKNKDSTKIATIFFGNEYELLYNRIDIWIEINVSLLVQKNE